MEDGQSLGRPIDNASLDPFTLFKKEITEVLYEVIKDAEGLTEEVDEEILEVKKSELSERLKTKCKLGVLENLINNIEEWKRSKSASKYGLYIGALSGIVAAASYAIASYISGKPPIDVLGLKIGYELVDKILKTSTVGSLFGFLVYGKNKLDVDPYEKMVMEGMIGLFGEDTLSTENNVEKGIGVVKDVYSNIIKQASSRGIPLSSTTDIY